MRRTLIAIVVAVVFLSWICICEGLPSSPAASTPSSPTSSSAAAETTTTLVEDDELRDESMSALIAHVRSLPPKSQAKFIERFFELVDSDEDASSLAFDPISSIDSTTTVARSPSLRSSAYEFAFPRDSKSPLSVSAASVAYSSDCVFLNSLFVSLSGNQWLNKSGWGHVSAACCDGSLYGITCDINGRVTKIQLYNNQLSGTFPDGVDGLTELTWLDLSGNAIVGPLPEGLGRLRKLTTVGLFVNYFSGSIPLSYSTMAQLAVLHLATNSLEGEIPTWICGLVNLQVLVLGDNKFFGSIPSCIGNLTLMNQLMLGGNALSGSIPPSLANLTGVTLMDISNNDLSGPLPSDFGRLTSLGRILLYSNRLSGPFPSSIQSMNLRDFIAYGNVFSGPIDVFANVKSLQLLDLSSNALSGSIPYAMSQMPNLKQLVLAHNPELTGMLFDFFSPSATLQSLQVIDVSHCALYGPVPGTLCNLSSLEVLNLDWNRFTSFNVSCNRPLSSMRLLSLTSNLLYAFDFDSFLTTFPKVTSLSVSDNHLSYPFTVIEPLVDAGSQLQSLDVSVNGFSGTFPLKPCGNYSRQLTILDVSFNSLTDFYAIDLITDPLNPRVCQTPVTSLKSLNLRSTDLHSLFSNDVYSPALGHTVVHVGTSQGFLALFVALQTLDISDNLFMTGPLIELQRLSSLNFLNMSATKMQQGPADDGFLQLTASDISYHADFNCYNAKSVAGDLLAVVDPQYFEYRSCYCNRGFFGKPPHCSPCTSKYPSQRADCPGLEGLELSQSIVNDAYRKSGNVYSKKGYWATPPCSRRQMEEGSCYPQSMLPCANVGTDATPCRPDESDLSRVCLEGHEGRLCSKCSVGYFSLRDRCIECTTSPVLVGFFFLVVLCAFLIILVYSFFVTDSQSGMVKIFVFFGQALSHVGVPMHDSLSFLPLFTSAATGIPLIGPECLFDNWNFNASFTVVLLIPFGALLLIGSIFLMGKLLRFNPMLWKRRVRRAITFLCFLLYFPLCRYVLIPLACDTDPGTHEDYMVAIPYQRCNPTLQLVSALLFVPIVFVMPGVFAYVVWKRNQAPTAMVDGRIVGGKSSVAILFASYRKEKFYWELLVIVRRFLFTACISTIAPYSTLRTFLLGLVFVVALLLNAIHQPFVRFRENALEFMTLSLLFFNLLVGQAFRVPEADSVDNISILFFVINLIMVVGLLILILADSRIVRSLVSSASSSSLSPRRSPAESAFRTPASFIDRLESPTKEMETPLIPMATGDNALTVN